MKLPAFQFYPADWRKDPGVQSLSRHDKSVWFDILCLMHESDERGVLLLAGKPMPVSALAMNLGLDEVLLKQILSTLITYGVASERESDGAIYSRRMVRDEKLIETRREAGKRGGNPILLNQNDKQNTTTLVKQKPTPSASSSSSSSFAEREPAHAPEQTRSAKTADNTAPPPTKTVTPSWPEVKARADLIGLAEWKAKDWWEEMEGCGWLDHLKRPVASWGAVLSRVKTKWDADGRPKGPPGNASKPQTNGASRPFQPRAKAESCL